MKKQLFILLTLTVLVASCTMEGSIQEPATNTDENTETPVKPSGDNNESGSESDNNSGDINTGNEDGTGNESNDNSGDINAGSGDEAGNVEGGDSSNDNGNDETEGGEAEPSLTDSIHLIQIGKRIYSFEESECIIEYPETLEGEIFVERSDDYETSILSGNRVSIKPLHNGPMTVKVCVGKHYNTCVLEVYDKLIFNLICEFSHETGTNPRDKNKVYNVYFLIENSNLPTSEDKYGISYEYREIMNGISVNKTASGRIGVNTPYHAGTQIRKGGSSSAILSTVAFESITISGISDKYVEFAVQDGEAFQQFAGEAELEFLYEQ